jgi:hypothetical protein
LVPLQRPKPTQSRKLRLKKLLMLLRKPERKLLRKLLQTLPPMLELKLLRKLELRLLLMLALLLTQTHPQLDWATLPLVTGMLLRTLRLI